MNSVEVDIVLDEWKFIVLLCIVVAELELKVVVVDKLELMSWN